MVHSLGTVKFSIPIALGKRCAYKQKINPDSALVYESPFTLFQCDTSSTITGSNVFLLVYVFVPGNTVTILYPSLGT